MTMDNRPKQLIFYQNQAGNEPVTDWLNRLRDAKTRRRILKRFFRVESGHYGDYKSVGGDVYELRFFFGAGYRVYFGEDGEKIVVLLAGGDKDSQTRDISFAKACWHDYLSHRDEDDSADDSNDEDTDNA